MPRKARIDAAGALHHIIIRGIERRKIFWDDEDRDSFVDKGIRDDKRPELVGGGLIRSLGGWVAAKAVREAKDRIKGDERISGDDDFVKEVLESSWSGASSIWPKATTLIG
jgi:hypothetical protein